MGQNKPTWPNKPGDEIVHIIFFNFGNISSPLIILFVAYILEGVRVAGYITYVFQIIRVYNYGRKKLSKEEIGAVVKVFPVLI